MLAVLLIKKIISLFLVMLCGIVLLKLKVLKKEDSRTLSLLTLYLLTPFTVLNAFQVDAGPQVLKGLFISFVAAVVIHVLLLLLNSLLRKWLKLDAVEQLSLMFSNVANLNVPLITAMLGTEWIIYLCSYVCVQNTLFWSYGKAILCEEKKIDFRKMFSNINIIVIVIGLIMLVAGFRLTGPLQDAVSSVAVMVGPTSMLVAGILIGGMDFKKVFAYKRLWLSVALRLLVVPAVVLVVLKYSGLALLVEHGEKILMTVLMASMTPPASMVMQTTQVYGKDAEYATAINVVCTLLCIITMPMMVALYQL